MHIQEYLCDLAESCVVFDRSSFVGTTSGHNSFTATTVVPTQTLKYRFYSTYNARKHFTPEVIPHSVVKYTNEEAYREGENDFD